MSCVYVARYCSLERVPDTRPRKVLTIRPRSLEEVAAAAVAAARAAVDLNGPPATTTDHLDVSNAMHGAEAGRRGAGAGSVPSSSSSLSSPASPALSTASSSASSAAGQSAGVVKPSLSQGAAPLSLVGYRVPCVVTDDLRSVLACMPAASTHCPHDVQPTIVFLHNRRPHAGHTTHGCGVCCTRRSVTGASRGCAARTLLRLNYCDGH